MIAAAFKKRHIHFKTTMDGMNDVVVVVVDGEGKGKMRQSGISNARLVKSVASSIRRASLENFCKWIIMLEGL